MRVVSALISLAALLIPFAANAEEPLGALYFSQNMPVSGTQSIFAAGSNVRGATIRTASAWVTANAVITLYANYPDGTQRMIFAAMASPNQNSASNLSNALRLPAGVGLSAVSAYGTSSLGAGVVGVTYDLY